MHNTWFLTFTERKDNQTSNKLNTIAIPLAATPLCMVANIVLVLSLGGNIPPNLIYITIGSHKTSLYTLHYYFLLLCRVWRIDKQLCFAPLICLEMFSIWCVAVVSLLILKQMDVNQNLPSREHKRRSVCLFLLWGGV